MSDKWTLAEAVEVCRAVEAICPKFGCHVALTGGCLYRDGERKDLDLVFYRIRQAPEIDWIGLWVALEALGFSDFRDYGFVTKATFRGRSVDLFDVEDDGGSYGDTADADQLQELFK